MSVRGATGTDAPPWDAVVVGGGPAGAVSALTLAALGRRVLLVERRTRVDFKLGETIPPQARPLIDALLGPGSEAEERADGRWRTYGNASSWGGSELATHDFVFTPHGYGFRLDRPRFDRALRRRAVSEGAAMRLGLAVVEMRRRRTWEVVLRRGRRAERHRARFLVDATGRWAAAATEAGARRVARDRLFAFAQTYRLPPGAVDQDTLTLVEAGADGWWYTARIPGNRRLVVFHTDDDLAAARWAATPEGFGFLLATTRHVRRRVAELGYTPVGRPRGAPAGSQRLDRFAEPATGDVAGWCAVGDAAQAFDPLSSQGIGTALRSGRAAAAAIHRALAGDDRATHGYVDAQNTIQADYRRRHRHFYGGERRFHDRAFWRRRQIAPDLARRGVNVD